MQYMKRQHARQVLQARLYFYYFTCYDVTDTQVARNLFQTSNDCMCVTRIVLKPIIVLYTVIVCQNPAAYH